MKTLVVSYMYLNGVGGGVFASRAYINALAEVSEKITLVYPECVDCKTSDISSKVEMIPVNYAIPKWRKLLVWLQGRCHLLKDATKRCLDREYYDLVVFNHSLACQGLIHYAHHKGAKVITLHHNFEQEYTRDNATSNGVISKIYMHNVIVAERNAVVYSDLNLTITEDDKFLLRKFYDPKCDAKIEVLGCFEPKKIKPLDVRNRQQGAYRFVITGSLSQVQTYKSLTEWLNRYFDILNKVCPGMSLTIAGKNPSEQIRKMCSDKGIRLIPNPEAMDDVLLDADYFICPVSLGGGLKLRIMDGLKAGLPILTHAVSARGYDKFKDVSVFSYADEQSFELSLRKIISKEFSALKIQNEYLSVFSFEAGVGRFKEFISMLSIM